LWIHGRCCGFSKVQNATFTGALLCAKPRRDDAVPRTPLKPAAPATFIAARRVSFLAAWTDGFSFVISFPP
jgi:hypothetical protein